MQRILAVGALAAFTDALKLRQGGEGPPPGYLEYMGPQQVTVEDAAQFAGDVIAHTAGPGSTCMSVS